MRLFFPAVIVLTGFLGLHQQNTKTQQPQQATAADQRGTQGSPVVVKVIPAPKTPEEIAQEKQDRNTKSANDGNVVKLTAVLAAVAVLQLFVYSYQAYKLRQTVKSAGEQSEAMERHIGEAARSANAMERIVTTIDEGNQAIMRAYLTVTIGTGIYQQRRGEGQTDLKFEARPSLLNTGATPARKVRIRIKAEILATPVPPDFGYPLPEDTSKSGSGVLGAHQSNIIFGGINDFVPDDEVAAIKEGRTKALFVWGLVTYEDIFGKPHNTHFGQMLTWLPNNNLFVYFIPSQNDSD